MICVERERPGGIPPPSGHPPTLQTFKVESDWNRDNHFQGWLEVTLDRSWDDVRTGGCGVSMEGSIQDMFHLSKGGSRDIEEMDSR